MCGFTTWNPSRLLESHVFFPLHFASLLLAAAGKALRLGAEEVSDISLEAVVFVWLLFFSFCSFYVNKLPHRRLFVGFLSSCVDARPILLR